MPKSTGTPHSALPFTVRRRSDITPCGTEPQEARAMEGTARHARWSLSLVIPAFNEQHTVRRALAEADDALARHAEDYEILLINDGSADATAREAEAEAELRPRVRVLSHETNRGYGAALRTGFTAAQFDRIAFTDADCQF